MNSRNLWVKFYFAATMNKEKYPYIASDNYVEFEFESKGPNGIIKKVVTYSEMGEWVDGTPIYNLAFGDMDASINSMDDLKVTNNADRDKVLATVANTVLDFMVLQGDIAVYAIGSTPARTRLYQMGINANKAEIEEMFDIYANTGEGWRKFERGINYFAFVVTRKKS